MAKDTKDQPTLSESRASAPLNVPTPAGPSIAGVKGKSASVAELQAAIENHTPVTGTFVLTDRHYRAGRMYEAGDLVSIVNEVPGRTWLPYNPAAKTAPAVPNLSASGSAVEQDI